MNKTQDKFSLPAVTLSIFAAAAAERLPVCSSPRALLWQEVLAAVLLIPEVCAILRTDFGNSDFPGTLESYFSVFDMLARHCLCVTTERGLEHWPNIYCGVAVFILVPM